MDGRELFRRLALRWPLVLVGLVLALAVGGIAAAVTPATYTAQAGVLVLPPPVDPGDTTPVNPLSSLDNGAIQVATTLVYTAGSAQSLDRIADASDGGSATVVNTSDDPTNDTPFIQISATGSSADNAVAAARATITVLDAQLAAIQSGSNVPRNLAMRLTVIVAPLAASPSATDLLKAGALAAIVVFVLALIAIAVLDRFLPADPLTRLRRRIGTRVRPAAPADGAHESVAVAAGSAAGRD